MEEKFKNRTAVFHGMTLKNSRYTDSDSGKTNYLLDPFDFPILAANNYNFPNNLKSIHAYDPNYLKLIQFNVDNQIKAMGKFDSIKEKLFKKQKGICIICNNYIHIDNIHSTELHIDHIIPILKKGRKSAISNMRLLHKYCHVKHHRSSGEFKGK